MIVAGKSLGKIQKFQAGRWLEQSIGPADSAEGKILIQARNLRQSSNAVLSILEWVAAK